MGAVVVLENRPLSDKQAMERIRRLWREGEMEWTAHAEQRLRERGLDLLDVENIIKYGRVVGNSRPDPGGGWRYEVRGDTVEHKRARCVVEPGRKLVIVTVIV
jgi:hypothetical protein